MIFAEIDGKYALDSLEDAETLLRILNRATPLSEQWDLPHPRRYYVDPNKTLIEIAVYGFEPFGYDEAQAMIDTKIRLKALKADYIEPDNAKPDLAA